jgi:hypothetical protein
MDTIGVLPERNAQQMASASRILTSTVGMAIGAARDTPVPLEVCVYHREEWNVVVIHALPEIHAWGIINVCRQAASIAGTVIPVLLGRVVKPAAVVSRRPPASNASK